MKGEKYYGFVHSPNFKFEYKKYAEDLVYAKVTFDYYNWLIKFHNNITKAISKKNESPIPNDNSKIEKIKVKVIALIYVYNGPPINRKNCNEIATKYDYKAIQSGEGLLQDYLNFSNNIRRIKV